MKNYNSSYKKYLLISVLMGVLFLASTTYAFAFEEITVFTNQKTYFLRDTVEIRGDIFSLTNEDLVKITIINPEGSIVYEIHEKIDREERDFEYKFTLLEQSLVKGIYTVNVVYNQKQATTNFILFTSHMDEEILDSTISFDKDFYSWTETVEIFVYAPSYNRSNQVEYIGFGSESEGKIEIQTGVGRLENYRLIETKHDSGIFHGKITLTGDPTVDANGNNRKDDASGISSNKYPFDGKLPARNNDEIKVIFSNDEQEIEITSQIKWNEGKMGWVKYIDGSSSSRLRVIDKDMDLRPESPDFITVNAVEIYGEYSEFRLKEIGVSTGIFEGAFPKNQFASFVYYDRTFPSSNSSTRFVKITPSTSFVDESIEPPPSLAKSKETTESSNLKIQIPDWVKTTAGWWGQGSISEPDFIRTLQYLIREQIIVIEDLGETGKWEDHNVSRWTKRYASMWSDGLIPDKEFVKGIQHIVEQGLIQVR